MIFPLTVFVSGGMSGDEAINWPVSLQLTSGPAFERERALPVRRTA